MIAQSRLRSLPSMRLIYDLEFQCLEVFRPGPSSRHFSKWAVKIEMGDWSRHKIMYTLGLLLQIMLIIVNVSCCHQNSEEVDPKSDSKIKRFKEYDVAGINQISFDEECMEWVYRGLWILVTCASRKWPSSDFSWTSGIVLILNVQCFYMVWLSRQK